MKIKEKCAYCGKYRIINDSCVCKSCWCIEGGEWKSLRIE